MAVSFLQSRDVSELCIGKPALRSLLPTATVAEALSALKRGAASALALWESPEKKAVAGRVCMVDVVCYLCSEENISSPAAALAAPVAALLPNDSGRLVRRVERNTSILDALDAILDGAQCLVVPIRSGRKKPISGGAAAASPDFCWLTPEDFVRFFVNSISLLSTVASLSISTAGVVRPASLFVHHRAPSLSAVPLIRSALSEQTSVAVLSDDGRLLGEISPVTLSHSDESAAAAIAALCAGDLVSYLECHTSPPASTVRTIKTLLKTQNQLGMLDLLESDVASPYNSTSGSSCSSSSGSSSSDEESTGEKRVGRKRRGGSYGTGETIVCHERSSLVAVLVQALAHRVGYVWVMDDECELVGIVSFLDILKIFHQQLQQPFEGDL